jgi:hypothetical protein
MDKVTNNLFIEGARIIFRNFAGKEGRFNPPGRRNFCVLIDHELAETLKGDGWNVKYLNPRNEGDLPQAYLQVSVNYENIPPKVVLITSKNKTTLSEDKVEMLDYAELSNIDLVIRPYNYSVNGRDGVKAYLKAGYFTCVEDEFEKKYDDIPDYEQGF